MEERGSQTEQMREQNHSEILALASHLNDQIKAMQSKYL